MTTTPIFKSALFFSWTLCCVTHAREISVDLTQPAPSGSTAILNVARQQVHLPYVVDRTDGGGGGATGGINEDEAVDIGTGVDGVFNSTTYSTWDVNGGASPNLITLDTSKVYEFSSFTVDSGITVRGQGSSPLRIRVQGNVRVDGTINLSGGNGNFAPSIAAPGGTTCCGGASGGLGGDPGGTGQGATGGAAGGLVGGGTGGVQGNPAPGGGGAGYSTAGLTGFSGTSAGNDYDNAFIGLLLGGSGGGGGGARTGTSFGASGGGGGGALLFHVGGTFIIGASGIIRSDGGDAGEASGNAGHGGAGSGGSILIFSGGIGENAGHVYAFGGLGPSGLSGAGSGQGSNGRIRYCTWNGELTPIGAGSDIPPPPLAPYGQTYYTLNSKTLVSAIYDAGNSSPTYEGATAVTTLPATTTMTVEIAASSDRFVTDDTGYVALTNLTSLQGKRYFRFRAILQTGDRTRTPTLESLKLQVKDREQPAFSFALTSCAGVTAVQTTPVAAFTSVVAMLLTWVFAILLGRTVSKKS